MNKQIHLMHPWIPEAGIQRAAKTLGTRWIGQGPQVDEFEELFMKKISAPHVPIAVNSGTSALHLAYILAGIKDDDEVICPVFSCSATMTPLLYQRAKVVFADIKKDSLNIEPRHVRMLMNERVKAIVCVHYGGIPADLAELQSIANEWHVPLIEDAAQAIGATYRKKKIGSISDFTAFSFQAVKIMTTVDGGMLTIKDPIQEEKAKRIRWFGIDRKAKFEQRWKKDIFEVGYKYQMTDVSAALGIEGLKVLDDTLAYYAQLARTYKRELQYVKGVITLNGGSNWLTTIFVNKRDDLKRKLAEHGIESDPTHYRCDRYSVFGGRVYNCPNMDDVENKYLLLPMHKFVTPEDVVRICEIIKKGW